MRSRCPPKRGGKRIATSGVGGAGGAGASIEAHSDRSAAIALDRLDGITHVLGKLGQLPAALRNGSSRLELIRPKSRRVLVDRAPTEGPGLTRGDAATDPLIDE